MSTTIETVTRHRRKKRPMSSNSSFPTLSVDLLDGLSQKTIQVNSDKPIPFETDLFKGVALILLRTSNGLTDNPVYHRLIFEGTKRNVRKKKWLRICLLDPANSISTLTLHVSIVCNSPSLSYKCKALSNANRQVHCTWESKLRNKGN